MNPCTWSCCFGPLRTYSRLLLRYHTIIADIKPGSCKSRRTCCTRFSGRRCFAARSSFLVGPCVGALRFLHRRFDVLLCIFSIKPHSKVAVRLGHRCDHLAFDSSLHKLFTQTDPFSTSTSLFSIPIGLNELVLAGWLIVKGFNPSAVEPMAAKAATSELLSAA